MSETRRMRLRSSVSEKEKEARKAEKHAAELEKKIERPFLKYNGKIKYCTNFVDCAEVCDELIKLADEMEDIFVVGFDIEWPFSFQTGSGKAALIQISPNLECCYLLQISALKKLPKGLNAFLSHSNVRITGNNIKNDARKLHRDFSVFDVDKIIANCIDTGVLTNSILPFTQRWSMEKLVAYLLKMRINKDKSVRMSKWHYWPLSKSQQHYAACDAYASLLLYHDLKRREKLIESKEDEQNLTNII